MASTRDVHPNLPEGWSYNPSAWGQRLPLVGLAMLGFAIATYLSLFQVGLVSSVWEPFFGSGSERVLRSEISRLLPIPDAALGAVGYLVDAVTGLCGGTQRYRTMPWMVVLFGTAVGPLGFVSVLLVVLQPTVVHAWCSLCLLSAAISIAMIGPSLDEVLASLQLMRRETARGGAAWQVFWGLDQRARGAAT